MITRKSTHLLRLANATCPLSSAVTRNGSRYPCQDQRQTISTSTSARSIPSPTPFVPDAATFLRLIGRKLSSHASKFPTWQSLFSLSGAQMKELGIEPARSRRYLLWWRDRFRNGVMGMGGDLKYVSGEGEAFVRAVEVLEPSGKLVEENSMSDRPERQQRNARPSIKKIVINEPLTAIPDPPASSPTSSEPDTKVEEIILLQPLPRLSPSALSSSTIIEGLKVTGVRTVTGPFVSLIKGSGGSMARIKAVEGMWEVKRGVKIDGGERRKVQVRRKRLLEERKTTRA